MLRGYDGCAMDAIDLADATGFHGLFATRRRHRQDIAALMLFTSILMMLAMMPAKAAS